MGNDARTSTLLYVIITLLLLIPAHADTSRLSLLMPSFADVQEAISLTAAQLVNAADDVTVVLDDTVQSTDAGIVISDTGAVTVNRGSDTTVAFSGERSVAPGNPESPQTDSPREDSTLQRGNSARRQAFVAAQRAVQRVPTDGLLPRMASIPPQARVSRGTQFFVPEIRRPSIDDLPADSPSLLLGADARRELFERDEITAIVVHKGLAEQSALPGEAYGSLKFTTIDREQLALMRSGTDSPYAYIASDFPVTVSIADIDSQVQGPLARAESGSQGMVGVCLIDTGIDHSNGAFSDNYVGGIDLVNNDSEPSDDNGHGTQMADAITTLAPGAQLYVVKALDQNGLGLSSDIIKAIDWCMQQDVAIISISAGGGYYDSWCDESSLLAQKANEAVARGFFVSAAAGNTGEGTMRSPACGSLVTSVSATAGTADERIASYASLTNVTDLLAPGTGVTLLTLGGSTKDVSGTSVSAAVVSGGSAVLLDSGVPAAALQERLRSTGVLLESNSSAYPRIDVYRAYTNATNGFSLGQEGFQSNATTPATVAGQDTCTELGPQASCTKNFHCYYCSSCTTVNTGVTCDFGTGTCLGQLATNDVGAADITCTSEAALCGPDAFGGSGSSCRDNYCSVSGDQDGDGLSDGCDTDCGTPECTSGTCCDTSACSYSRPSVECRPSVSSETCDPAEYCTGSSSACPLDFRTPSGTSCGSGEYCSGSSVYEDRCDGAGYCVGTEIEYCSQGCDSGSSSCITAVCGNGIVEEGEDCDSASECCYSCSFAPYGDQCGNSDRCIGQGVYTDMCNGAGTCTTTLLTTCAGTCGSWCSGSSCGNAPALTESADCSSGNYCSGQNVVYDACTGSGTCGTYTSSTCSGTESSFCSGGSCANFCATAGDQDGNGLADSCDTNCPAGTTARGGTCSCDYECSSSSTGDACKSDVYQGGAESARCAPANYCVTDASSPYYFAAGSTVGDSACYAGTGTVWLASAGRFMVQNTTGTVLAVIDKYGSMGIRGTESYGQSSFDSGWQVKNSAGTTRASVSSASGNFRTAGALSERTTPGCTGFQVRNTAGTLVACISSTGAVQLVGDTASGLSGLS